MSAKVASVLKSKKSPKSVKAPSKVNPTESDSGHLRKLIETAQADPSGTIRYGSAGKKQDPESQEKKTPEFVCEISNLKTPENLVPDCIYTNVIQTGCRILGLQNKDLRDILSKFGCGDATKALPILRDDNTRPLLMEYLKKHCPTSNNRGETINPVIILNAVHQMQKTAFSGDPMLASEIEELSKCWNKEDSGSAPVTEEEIKKEMDFIKQASSDKTTIIREDTRIDEESMFNEQRKFKPTAEVSTGKTVIIDGGNKSGTPVSNSELMNRARKAGEILEIPPKVIMETLNSNGIRDNQYGIKLLESATVTLEDLMSALAKIQWTGGGKNRNLALKAAVIVLKGQDPFGAPPKVEVTKGDTSLYSALQGLRTISQMKDVELIELYDKSRDIEIEEELDRRAKHKNFVILSDEEHELGREKINIELTCEQLRKSRKGYTVPSMIPGKDKKIVRVYRITELNPDDRIVELCPICGEILYKGYCSKCELDFSGVGDDERSYVKLISNSEKFNARSHSDRKAVHASASKGLEDLRTTWPSIAPTFDDLKLTNSLPKLRMIKNIPATQVADPFHVSGNRSF
jgi:hypothetical protein